MDIFVPLPSIGFVHIEIYTSSKLPAQAREIETCTFKKL
jgi:hypothetical protein